MNCPCKSGKQYELCCEGFITQRERPENAQQLMRSRYSAYVLKDEAYLKKTWHEEYRPDDLSLENNIHWLRLKVLDSASTGSEASVEFEALYLTDGMVNALHENSHFMCVNGEWLYTTGEMKALTFKPWKPGRNESCPCGSQLIFKRCCQQAEAVN